MDNLKRCKDILFLEGIDMRLILAGCEYSGTTTLSQSIDDWMQENMGCRFSLIHDHWKIPHTSGHPDDTTEDEQNWLLNATPKIMEMHQRHSIYYHIQPATWEMPDWMAIGLHIDDSVYGPMYFGYGLPDTRHDRRIDMHRMERSMLRFAQDLVLVNVTASPNTIRERMETSPHPNQIVKKDEVEKVMSKFDELVNWSLIPNKITVDTTSKTKDESLQEFMKFIRPFLSDTDRSRIAAHKALISSGN